MGRFSTTVHIKNNDDRMRFINTFSDVMKKRGFVPCSEDEAAVSYLFAFGEGGWATLANEDYKDNPKKSSEDICEMSKALKTSAFSVEVVDSDFAIMTLCAPNGTEDRVVVGDGSGYGVSKAEGDRKLWEPLLADGKTLEEFSEAAAAREVFVENALGKLAAVLGIDPYYMDADYDDVLEKADGNNNITAFYFKAVQEKVMSLNAAFKKVFGEALAPLGYKPVKGKYPYLVRVIPGGEIIHVITCEESLCSYPRARKFDIVGGIATVYRHRIDLDYSSKHNNIWLNPIGTFYARTVLKSEYNQQTFESLDGIKYKENDNLSLLNAMNRALEFANKYMLPYLNRAVDLKSSLNYIKVLRQKCSTNNFSYPLNFEGCGHHDEGFLHIKTENEVLTNTLKGKIDGTILCDEQSRQKAAEKYAFFTDPEVLTELERRKAANTEILRSCGLDI